MGVGEFAGRSPEEIIVATARISTEKEGDELFDKPERLIQYTIGHGHWSPFDMVDVTFSIKGISMVTSLHLIRHWSFKPQQFSQRYSVVSDGVIEVELRNANKNNRQSSTDVSDNWLQDIARRSNYRALTEYQTLVSNGVAPETARMILPMATRTRMNYKGSVRSIITFLDQRLSKHTQKETRQVAEAMRDILIEHFPIISGALNNFLGADQIPILDQLAVMRNLQNIEKIKELWKAA